MRAGGRGAGAVLWVAALLVVPAVAQARPPSVVGQSAGPVTAEAPPPRPRHARGDPLEGFNRAMFSVNAALDRLFFRPLAKTYQKVVPKLVRKAFRNIFSNIQEPLVFANDVLQLKPKRAVHTLLRFAINSSIGIGGTLDLAKTEHVGLVHHDNSFGNTLGRYGIGPGPYLYLPLFGPNDLRDFTADLGEGQVLPFVFGTPFDRAEYRVSRGVITGLDLRAEADGALNALLGGAVDPYATLRSAYLQDRAGTIAELRHSAPTAGQLDDPLADPAGTTVVAPKGSPLDDPLADPAAGASATPAIDPVTTAPPPVTLP